MIEIYQTPTGWRWRIKDKNGEILATGGEYSTRMGAVRGAAVTGIIIDDPETEVKFLARPKETTQDNGSFAHLKHDMEYADQQRANEREKKHDDSFKPLNDTMDVRRLMKYDDGSGRYYGGRLKDNPQA